jgi:hypothetical protein
MCTSRPSTVLSNQVSTNFFIAALRQMPVVYNEMLNGRECPAFMMLRLCRTVGTRPSAFSAENSISEALASHEICQKFQSRLRPLVPPCFILRAGPESGPLILDPRELAAFHRNIALYDHDGSCHPYWQTSVPLRPHSGLWWFQAHEVSKSR